MTPRGLTFETDPIGERRAVLHGRWTSELAEELREADVYALVLSYTSGFRGENLSFLEEVPFLTKLVVIDRAIDDISGLEQLTHLEHLDLLTYAKTPLDFSRFPRLKECHLEWIRGSDSIFTCRSLRKLEIYRFPDSTMRRVGEVTELESLWISHGRRLRSLAGLERCGNLSALTLAYLPNLHSFDAIGHLRGLERLWIETCRHLESLEFASSLHRLRELVLGNCGELESLAPLNVLRRLETVHFWESTNVRDGDMSALLELPLLGEVRFRNRRHYNYTSEEIMALVKSKR